jgi:hypothetical protein
LILFAVLVACGGGGGSSTAPPAIQITVSQGVPASLFPNNAADNWPLQTAQFTATVANGSSSAVTWSVAPLSAGMIDGNGLYTTPTVAAGLPTSAIITARSVADGSKSALVFETINAATVPTPMGQPYTIYVYAFEHNTQKSVPVTLAVQ